MGNQLLVSPGIGALRTSRSNKVPRLASGLWHPNANRFSFFTASDGMISAYKEQEGQAVKRTRAPNPKGREPGSGAVAVAIVTGAGRGIGRATAEAFAAKGYAVVIAELRPALGRLVERALASAAHPVLFLPTDVTDPTSVERCVRRTHRRFGRIDCLVNNAGVLRVAALADLAVRDLDQMLGVNLRGPLLMSRAVVPAMLRQGSGTIINVSSLLGKAGAGHYVTYCASKFGVVGLTEALADELDGMGINVWAVCPGQVDTMMARQTGTSAEEFRGALKPEQIAHVILSLATGRKRARSGTALDIT